LEQLVVFGLPDDWYDVYRTNIRAVSSADVHAAAKAYLHPEQLQFVIVGDAAAIRDPLEALELGPVGVHDE
jgi:predicted Zn-dependent peptidase